VSDAVDSILEKWTPQLRKGLLEFVVLLCLREDEHYGYALIREVKEVTSLEITEGTIYPLLDRLKTEELVTARWEEPEEGGVPRKYYHLTERGREVLERMEETWARLSTSIDALSAKSAHSS
jgi:PadR family transcriptional regulator PadR